MSSFTNRTDALLLRLSVVVGREVFHAALWGSVLTSPSIRLPASLFVVNHISRDSAGKEQKCMLGTDYQLTVGALLPKRCVAWSLHQGQGDSGDIPGLSVCGGQLPSRVRGSCHTKDGLLSL